MTQHLKFSNLKTTTLIRDRKLRGGTDRFLRVTIGKASFDRYPQKQIDQLREGFEIADLDKARADHRATMHQRTRS